MLYDDSSTSIRHLGWRAGRSLLRYQQLPSNCFRFCCTTGTWVWAVSCLFCYWSIRNGFSLLRVDFCLESVGRWGRSHRSTPWFMANSWVWFSTWVCLWVKPLLWLLYKVLSVLGCNTNNITTPSFLLILKPEHSNIIYILDQHWRLRGAFGFRGEVLQKGQLSQHCQI